MDMFSVLPKMACAMDDLDWIRKGLKKPGKTQTGLAQALGRSPSTVTNLLNGKRALKQREVPVVARYLGVSPPETAFSPHEVEEHDPDRVVRVAGYVGAGAEAHYYAVAQGDLDEVAPPHSVTERTVAVEVRGDSLGALFDRGLVFYDDVRSPVTPDLVGKLCVVGLPDDRVLVKKIRRGKNGLYDLVSNSDADTLRGVAIDWAAAVRMIVPR